MDYEKKYKEALEWARKVMHGKVGFVLDDVLEKFPELKESEDERIRKELIKALETCKWCGNKYWRSDLISIDDALAWLEKQGEQKPAEWSEEDEESLLDLIKFIENWKAKGKDFTAKLALWTANEQKCDRLLTFLKSLRTQNRWKPSDE